MARIELSPTCLRAWEAPHRHNVLLKEKVQELTIDKKQEIRESAWSVGKLQQWDSGLCMGSTGETT